jgi:hypothetical protein
METEESAMRYLNIAMVAVTALLGAMLVSRAASAMPVSDLAAASGELSADIQKVRWVCGPYRCWWQPNYYYAYPFWRPRLTPYAYRWGYRLTPYAYDWGYRHLW